MSFLVQSFIRNTTFLLGTHLICRREYIRIISINNVNLFYGTFTNKYKSYTV